MKNGIVVIGAGGHAKVCVELLHAMGEQIDYCIGSTDDLSFCLDIPVLKGDMHIKKLRQEGYQKVFVAIGDNKLRNNLGNQVIEMGYHLVNAISPNAIISTSAFLGRGIAIMPGVVINAQSKIQNLAIINTGATIDHDCEIGVAAHVAPQTGLAGNVKINDRCFLGIGSKVIPNVEIGENTIIGAGSIVISNLPKDITAVGVPAKIIKHHF